MLAPGGPEYFALFEQAGTNVLRAAGLLDEMLSTYPDISKHTIEINRLENEGDRLTREAMGDLFDTRIDPMVVIRWKDLYERLEAAIDATEDVANIMEGIGIKNR